MVSEEAANFVLDRGREVYRQLKASQAENERLRAALREIDRVAVAHVAGAIGIAQKIARGALRPNNPPEAISENAAQIGSAP